MIWFSASWIFTILPNSVGLLALPLRITSVVGFEDTDQFLGHLGAFAQSCSIIPAILAKLLIFILVEAGGVEPIHAIENTQVTDFGTPPIQLTPQIPSAFAQFCSLAPPEGSGLSNHTL